MSGARQISPLESVSTCQTISPEEGHQKISNACSSMLPKRNKEHLRYGPHELRSPSKRHDTLTRLYVNDRAKMLPCNWKCNPNSVSRTTSSVLVRTFVSMLKTPILFPCGRVVRVVPDMTRTSHSSSNVQPCKYLPSDMIPSHE